MKLLRNILLIAIACLSMAMDCGERPVKGPIITSYVEPQNMHMRGITVYSPDEHKDNDSTKFSYSFSLYEYDTDGETCVYQPAKDFHSLNEEKRIENEKIYRALCIENNDYEVRTVWYRRRELIIINPTENISISCDKDFDVKHPAGTLLNDIVYIEYGYIFASGNGLEHGGKEERLDKFNSKQTPLMQTKFVLHFKTRPEKGNTYNFTITYKDSKGKTLSSTVQDDLWAKG